MHISGKPKKDKNKDGESSSISDSRSSIGTPGSSAFQRRNFGQTADDADPGVISEDDDEFVFDNLSHKSSGSSLNVVKSNAAIPPSVKSNTVELQNDSPQLSTSNLSVNDPNDIKLRTKTLPPSKPPRIPSDPTQKVDEWEAKLYGKHLEVGSTDSLKRRSWESSRLPLSTKEEDHLNSDQHEYIQSNTAPTTPNLEDQKRTETIEKPRPLPRSATLESIEERDRADFKENEKIEKKEKSEKRFSKLKFYRKDKADSVEDLKGKLSSNQKQFGERIIIGHENDLRHHDLKLSNELQKKYEGKSREVSNIFCIDKKGKFYN